MVLQAWSVVDLKQLGDQQVTCMFWVEMMLYVLPTSPMKLKERPANPYMTGSELPPAQLACPFWPHWLLGVVVPCALAPGGGELPLVGLGDLESCSLMPVDEEPPPLLEDPPLLPLTVPPALEEPPELDPDVAAPPPEVEADPEVEPEPEVPAFPPDAVPPWLL